MKTYRVYLTPSFYFLVSADSKLDVMEKALPFGAYVEEEVANMTIKDLQVMFDAYVECALWADGNADSKLTKEELRHVLADCVAFIEDAGSLLDGLDAGQTGHDFYLTRNHHGAGFWDRGLGLIGDKLTDLAEAYGETDYDFYLLAMSDKEAR